MTFLLAYWRVILVALLLGAIAVQTYRLDVCKGLFHDFQVSVEALGKAQEAETKRVIAEREKAAQEVVDALKKQNKTLADRYAAARRVLDNPGSSPVPTLAAAAAGACPSTDNDLAGRMASLEGALLEALERADAEMIKFRELWAWASRL